MVETISTNSRPNFGLFEFFCLIVCAISTLGALVPFGVEFSAEALAHLNVGPYIVVAGIAVISTAVLFWRMSRNVGSFLTTMYFLLIYAQGISAFSFVRYYVKQSERGNYELLALWAASFVLTAIILRVLTRYHAITEEKGHSGSFEWLLMGFPLGILSIFFGALPTYSYYSMPSGERDIGLLVMAGVTMAVIVLAVLDLIHKPAQVKGETT